VNERKGERNERRMGSLTRGCHSETPSMEGGWVRRKKRREEK